MSQSEAFLNFQVRRGVAALVFMASGLAAYGDEVMDMKVWQNYRTVAEAHPAVGYLPTNLSPVSSKEDVFQQVANYNLQQLKNVSPLANKVIGVKIAGPIGRAPANSGGNGVPVASRTTFEIRPAEGKAAIHVMDIATASVHYQILSHQSEALITPEGSFHGAKLAVSFINNSTESSGRLVLRYDW